MLKKGTLFAALQQPFVIAGSITDLTDITYYLQYNGFMHLRRNDYYNQQIGLLLEDVHEENVLTSKNKLFFIDTVFYINVL